ncbi:hypothetical protein [Devosia sp. YR412]|nr:hypothetical protein [Devosia sp. YR412]
MIERNGRIVILRIEENDTMTLLMIIGTMAIVALLTMKGSRTH